LKPEYIKLIQIFQSLFHSEHAKSDIRSVDNTQGTYT